MDGAADQKTQAAESEGQWKCDSIAEARTYGVVPYLQGPETWYESKGTEHQNLRHGLETIRATA